MNQPITVILLGDIAAGKGTQAKFLIEKFQPKHIDTGAYSRKLVAEKVEGAINRVEKGKLTKSELIQEYLINELADLNDDQSIIIDGGKMPEEAQIIYDILTEKNRNILVLYLKVPMEESMKRFEGRKRADDDPEAIMNRQEYYRDIYSQTIAFWKEKGLMIEIDALGSVDEVRERISNAINTHYNL